MKHARLATSLIALTTILAGCDDIHSAIEPLVQKIHGNEAAGEAETDVINLEGNPFAEEWDTPYGTPPFSEIKDEHYMPAIKACIVELQE